MPPQSSDSMMAVSIFHDLDLEFACSGYDAAGIWSTLAISSKPGLPLLILQGKVRSFLVSVLRMASSSSLPETSCQSSQQPPTAISVNRLGCCRESSSFLRFQSSKRSSKRQLLLQSQIYEGSWVMAGPPRQCGTCRLAQRPVAESVLYILALLCEPGASPGIRTRSLLS